MTNLGVSLGPLTGCWISQGALRDLGLAPSPLGGLGPAGLKRAGNKRTSDDCEGSRESRAEIQTAADILHIWKTLDGWK